MRSAMPREASGRSTDTSVCSRPRAATYAGPSDISRRRSRSTTRWVRGRGRPIVNTISRSSCAGATPAATGRADELDAKARSTAIALGMALADRIGDLGPTTPVAEAERRRTPCSTARASTGRWNSMRTPSGSETPRACDTWHDCSRARSRDSRARACGDRRRFDRLRPRELGVSAAWATLARSWITRRRLPTALG